MHGASPSGVSLFELTINGLINRNIPSPNTKETLVTLTHDCDLTTPGEYQLQLRIQDTAGNWSEKAFTSLIISTETTKTPRLAERATSTPTIALTPTITPTVTVTPTQANAAKIKLERISTNTVYAGLNSCGNQYVTFLVTASDPQGIKVVALFYRFQPADSAAWEIVAMNPLNNNLFEYTINLASIFGTNPPFEQATLQYQAVIQNNVGDTSTRTDVFSDITVLTCGAEVTCSEYNDPRTCNANGCSWSSVPGTTPEAFICKNP